MSINFLISTTNRNNLDFVAPIFQNIQNNVYHITCVNQCITAPLPQEPLAKDDLKVLSVHEKGVSKSRNLALKNAIGDICVQTDDDLVYLPNCITDIQKVYDEDPDLDVAIFQVITPEGRLYKKYRKKPSLIKSPFRVMQVSAAEITFRKKSIIEKQIQFNEKMGLGAEYTKGEEPFFIKDCINNGLKVKFFPISFVIHPYQSSGKQFNDANIIANGIMYRKLFPVVFPLVCIYFSLKKFNRYKKQSSFWHFLTLTFKGSLITFSK